MSEDKVFYPEVVEDAPFPGQDVPVVAQTQSNPAGTYTPATTKPVPFRQKIVSHETIGSSLNTRSRRILGEFQFTQNGAMQIGKYENGVSGDLRISPDGITARDMAGLTTFAIDGTTGNAVFKGDVQAGDFKVIDENGLVSLSNFFSDSIVKSISQTITGDNVWTDISDLTFNIILVRETHILFFGVIPLTLTGFDASAQIRINYNGEVYPGADGWLGFSAQRDLFSSQSFSFVHLLTLPSGNNVVKLQAATSTPDETLYINYAASTNTSFGYVVLGR